MPPAGLSQHCCSLASPEQTPSSLLRCGQEHAARPPAQPQFEIPLITRIFSDYSDGSVCHHFSCQGSLTQEEQRAFVQLSIARGQESRGVAHLCAQLGGTALASHRTRLHPSTRLHLSTRTSPLGRALCGQQKSSAARVSQRRSPFHSGRLSARTSMAFHFMKV